MAIDVAEVLADKRAALEAELGHLAALPADHDSGISFGKRVGEGTSIAVERLSQVAAHDRMLTTLADVVRAQEKLAEGTYGLCDNCGCQIAEARLEALPWAVLCINCASRR
jgi:DnaK suppressor protein